MARRGYRIRSRHRRRLDRSHRALPVLGARTRRFRERGPAASASLQSYRSAPEYAALPRRSLSPTRLSSISPSASRRRPPRTVAKPVKSTTARKAYSTATTTRKTSTPKSSASSSGSELSKLGPSWRHDLAIPSSPGRPCRRTHRRYQAVAYYKSGRILISTSHTSSLDRIIKHECWHIIDWREQRPYRLGENVRRDRALKTRSHGKEWSARCAASTASAPSARY